HQPVEEYIGKHILVPLKMTSSTFEQPPPGALAAQVSLGYTTPEKGPKPFELCSPVPAGALSTTATDMSRFMLALLNGGTLDDATIIRPETLAQMQSRQFELDSNLHAMGLGFMEYTRNGHTMWGHGGDTIVFHSDLFLIPDAHVGVYISYNSAGAQPGSGRGEVLRAFMTRYFPEVELSPRTKLTDTVAHGREVAGVYEVSRKSETNPLKIGALLGQMSVSSDRDGVIMIEGAKNARGLTKRWREVAPYFYDEIDGPGHVAFRRDQNGHVTDLLPDTPIDIGQRVSGLKSKTVLMPLIGGSLAFMALTLLFWPVAAFIRRHYDRVLWPDRMGRVLHVLARIVCLILIAMLATFGLPLARVGEDVGYLGEKIDPWLHATHVLGWVGSLGLLISLAAAVRAWRTSGVGWWARVHSTLLAIAALTFVAFAWRYHLLSASLKF
ncbi:MAG: serine hydrolase domain-containing protein, partial [Chthoniobacterales bacterium]